MTLSRVLIVSHRLPVELLQTTITSSGQHPSQWTCCVKNLEDCPTLCAGVDSIPSKVPVVWLGWLPPHSLLSFAPPSQQEQSTSSSVAFTKDLSKEARSALLDSFCASSVDQRRRQYIPVDLDLQQAIAHHDVFCRGVLWPLFHYMLDNNGGMDLVLESEAWISYQRVNEAFANAVIDTYQPGDHIWINDYHLLLAPAMIRRALPEAIIGLYLHVPFPSSEIFRCLPVRSQLLDGMLSANVVGFQV